MIYDVKVDEKDYKLEIVEEAKSLKVSLNGRTIKLDNHKSVIGQLTMFLQENQPIELELSRDNGVYDCWLNSRLARCEVIDEKTAKFAKLMGVTAGASKTKVLKAPMPGLIVNIEVEVGQEVAKGDGLIIIEAMKMENELKASQAGKIKHIKIINGQAVEKNQVMIEFE
ncbi:MAG: biotin/lipoyl-binding protein [candidate division Zixibacteria bacterium]|nr:biotin/lipoyl-binding protein [candidate division Zixibacteria bacterium]